MGIELRAFFMLNISSQNSFSQKKNALIFNWFSAFSLIVILRASESWAIKSDKDFKEFP